MNDQKNKNEAYEKAKKRVEDEKGFYSHLSAYVVVNVAILLFRSNLMSFSGFDFPNENIDFSNWLSWHNISTPFFWGIGLAAHGIWVFGRNSKFKKLYQNSVFSKEWEEKKIKQLMEDEDF